MIKRDVRDTSTNYNMWDLFWTLNETNFILLKTTGYLNTNWIFDIKELLLILRYNKDIVACINILMNNMVSRVCFKIMQDENK